MHILRKYISPVLCVCMMLALLTGCGSAEPATEPVMPPAVETQASNIPYFPMDTVPATQPMTDVGTAIPEKPWAVEDWVMIQHQEEFSWTDGVGNLNRVSVTIPGINPVTDFALAYNEEMRLLGQQIISEILDCQEGGYSCSTLGFTFEAYLNDNILSIVLIHQFDADYTEYTVHSFHLEEGRQLTLTDFSEVYLDLDYPGFLLVTNTLIENEFKEKYESYGTENEPELYQQILDSISSDSTSILCRELFLGENGQLMLLYDAPSMAGAAYYPTIAPFDVRQAGLTEEPEDEQTYNYLFNLALQSDGAYATACETILKKTFDEDADDFSEELAKRAQEEIDTIALLLASGYGIEKDKLAYYAEYLEEDNVKTAILSAIENLS